MSKVNFETKETILKSIEQVAKEIANNVVLKINDVYYRIIDFEFYVFAKGEFEDTYTHQHDIQLESNKFYLHRSGVDITFGDGINHGGVLLRSVIKLSSTSQNNSGFVMKQTNGPRKVATELFSNLYPLDVDKLNEIIIFKVNDFLKNNFYSEEKIIRTKRIGLTAKESDKEFFYKDLLLRYIVVLPKSLGLKQEIHNIENVIKDVLKIGEIKLDEAEKILGYKRNFE